eukprot:TRINITY_DN10193_c0_g1_i2.p1 TRINITY_DN10193_c0_g1~~TRINITY_DN10193_c0_g1_i2.p1  ORF type:complete len:226 (+),score=29.48 TRINITY_DN10193_c0_g1_i2:116-793(+)
MSRLLSAGQMFRGIQMVKTKDTWNVNVVIQHCDFDNSYLCGTMEAVNVPNEKSSVLTFWEGEIIDTVEKFWTKQWSAERKTDLSHWSQFGAFAVVKEKLECEAEVLPEDILGTHIFMRWKEKFFVKVGSESRITIAGFYYICFSRSDGTIDGYYYDPLSSPFQRIRLESSLKTGGSINSSCSSSIFSPNSIPTNDIATSTNNNNGTHNITPGGLHGYAFPTYTFH